MNISTSPDAPAASASALSIQERLYPDLVCFGCGHANDKGLKLRSFAVDGAVTAEFLPWPEHDNGGGYLNGGIICTLLDCHSGAAVIDEARRRDWWLLGGATLPYVTAGIDVRYLRPCPLGPVELRAELVEVDERAMTVALELTADSKVRAAGTALWKRWRPR